MQHTAILRNRGRRRPGVSARRAPDARETPNGAARGSSGRGPLPAAHLHLRSALVRSGQYVEFKIGASNPISKHLEACVQPWPGRILHLRSALVHSKELALEKTWPVKKARPLQGLYIHQLNALPQAVTINIPEHIYGQLSYHKNSMRRPTVF